MKPKIGVVFPKITDKDIADLEIEMMMQRKMIRMILMQEISAILDSGIFRFIMMTGETTLQ